MLLWKRNQEADLMWKMTWPVHHHIVSFEYLYQWFSTFFSHSSLTNPNTVNSSPTMITNNSCENFTLPTVRSDLRSGMVRLIMELVGNRSFTLITANGKQIRDPSTQPFIFNIYTSDLSTTVSEKYLYCTSTT